VLAQEGNGAASQAPGVAFLLGKILNAFLLDHVDVDIDILTRLNNVIADGAATYGVDFVERMSQQAERHSRPAYRAVKCLALRPSEDIGRLASEHVQRGRFRGDPIVTKRLLTMLDLGGGTEADLASYLLFDGTFCRQLIEMGRADAKARREELLAFFGDAAEDGGKDEGEGESGHWEHRSTSFPLGT
jgi:NTE family protein